MTKRLPTATARELIAGLRDIQGNTPVRVWLPGSTIALTISGVIERGGEVLIEGNVDPGSALSQEEPA